MGNLTANFDVEEFVPRSVFRRWGMNSVWFLCRPHVESVQWLRTRIDVRLVCNNWHLKNPGTNFFRGLRTPDAPSYKEWSQHSGKMNATDLESPDMSVKELYDWILDNQDEVIAKTSIRAVEDIKMTPTWLHLDSRWLPNAKGIFVVQP